MRYLVSLDCGQSHDFSAALITRRVGERLYATSIDRAPLRTSYTNIARAVVSKCVELESEGAHEVGLVLDSTGVGRAVADLVRAEIAQLPPGSPEIRFFPVSSTSGSRTTVGGGSINVPKKDLVAAAVLQLQQDRLRIGEIEGAELLIREMREFRIRLTDRQHETFEGSGRNDDLVSALCLAAWAWSQIPATETGAHSPRRSWGSSKRGAAAKPRTTGTASGGRRWGKKPRS